MRPILTATVLALVVLAAGAASADPKAVAKRHFDAGFALMQSEDYPAAVLEFTESLRLYKTKSAFFNLANCHKAMKRYGEAVTALDQLEKEFGSKLDDEMKAAVAAMRKEIQLTTGWLDVLVDRAGASVFVDGALVGQSPLPARLLLGPGSHEVSAEIGGERAPAQTVMLLSGQKKRVDLSFGPAQAPQPAPVAVPAPVPVPAPVAVPAPVPAPAPAAVQGAPPPAEVEGNRPTEAPRDAASLSMQKKWGHGLLWSGVILIVAGGVSTGVAAVHGKRVADTDYKPAEERSLSRLWSGIMWGGYGAGLALTVTGIVLLATAKKGETAAPLALAPVFDGQTAALVVRGEW